MVFVGIDASLTNTGVCVLRNGVESVESWKPGKLRGISRLAFFREKFTDLLGAHIPSLISIEGYSYGSTGKVYEIGELGCVPRLSVLDAGIDLRSLIVVPPTVLKKYVTGKGNAPKDTMILHVYKKWGFETDDNNMADAYALARFAEHASLPPEKQTKAFQALLSKAQTCA